MEGFSSEVKKREYKLVCRGRKDWAERHIEYRGKRVYRRKLRLRKIRRSEETERRM